MINLTRRPPSPDSQKCDSGTQESEGYHCTPCPAGKYSERAGDRCIPCAKGKHQPANGTAACELLLGCSTPQPGSALPAPPTPEAQSAQSTPLAILVSAINGLAAGDPSYAGSFVDGGAVIVQFTDNAEARLRRLSGDPRYVARQVRYSLRELQATEQAVAELLSSRKWRFNILTIDIPRNRVTLSGVDRRQFGETAQTLIAHDPRVMIQ